MASLLLLVLLPLALAAQSNADAQKIYERAQTEYISGNAEGAVHLYDQCIKLVPSMTEAYNGRAAARTELRDFAGALTDYSIALELDPVNYDARLGRASVFYKLNRFAEARDDYRSLLSLDAGETNTVYFQKSASPKGTMQITTAQSDFRPLILNQLGLTEYQLKNYSEALKWLDSAISLRSNEADYYVNRGLVRDKLGDVNARADFEKALSLNPGHTTALSVLGSSSKESVESRKSFLNKAIESDSASVYAYVERAYQNMQEGNYQQALADYDMAIKLETLDPDLWLNRGFVREKLNDAAGAYSDYSRAIQLKENYTKAWLNRGNLLTKLGRLEEALEDYSVAITYEPEYAAAYYNRGIVHERKKSRAAACNDLKKAEALGMKVDDKLRNAACE